VTQKDKDAFRTHLEAALQHVNTFSVWGFISLICFICVRGKADAPWEIVLLIAGLFSGGMAGINFRWAVRELSAANAIAKRNRS